MRTKCVINPIVNIITHTMHQDNRSFPVLSGPDLIIVIIFRVQRDHISQINCRFLINTFLSLNCCFKVISIPLDPYASKIILSSSDNISIGVLILIPISISLPRRMNSWLTHPILIYLSVSQCKQTS